MLTPACLGGLQGACPGRGLAELRVLGMGDFPRASLPEALTQLTALRLLSLRGGRIAALPGTFGQLAALQMLDLRFCEQLTALPGSFSRLAALQTLTCWGCKALAALPDLRVGLGALRKLDIRGCTSLVAVPAFNEHPRLQVTYDPQHLEGTAGEGRVSHASVVVAPVLGSPVQLWVPPHQRCRAPSACCPRWRAWLAGVAVEAAAAAAVLCGGALCPANSRTQVRFELPPATMTDIWVVLGVRGC
jgi:hypothetical protein